MQSESAASILLATATCLAGACTAPSAPLQTAVTTTPSQSIAVTATPARQPFVSKCVDVAFEIRLKAGEAGLQLTGALRNNGTRPVDVALTGDGSSNDGRNPTVSFALLPNLEHPPRKCGFINAMEDGDFVTINAGASHPLQWLYPPPPSAAGRYTLTATYRNDPGAVPLRGGAPQPATTHQLALLAQTAPCELASNVLTFDWNGTAAKPL